MKVSILLTGFILFAASFVQANVDANLKETFALERSRLVKDPVYKLHIKLEKEKETFAGEETLSFRLVEKEDDVWVDFKYGEVTELLVNRIKVEKVEIKDFRIRLPEDLLVAGQNDIFIRYTQKFSKNGTGLYRFQDPQDKQVYIYSMFEPYDANHMFPSFDQPDMKGVFHLTVEAPSDWVVISSGKEKQVGRSGRMIKWAFEETLQISPYIFSLHAGPYKVWKSQAGEIPLRLFARKSLAKYVRVSDWFEPTRHGFKFFQSYFNYPYPFKKYDQLIVPDFNYGAMENVAAVTFAERYVIRGTPTTLDRERLAETLLHEMAHMWFGNLVTMRWWNGLWLNESFATYLSMMAVVQMKDFSYSWQTFNTSIKSWAYWEDQLVTTHPIEGQVPDTLSAFVNFDGITYGKGASVLKQLHYFLGEEAFRDGLRIYFKAHEYGNTEIKDFTGALASSSGMDLREWSKLWLEKAGLDSIRPEYECVQGRVKTFDLLKTPPGAEPVDRPHRTQIALFDVKNNRLVKRKTANLRYQTASTIVSEFIGEKCPGFVYSNFGDYDYVKVELDGNSIETAKKYLSTIDDVLLRTMIWGNLFEMLRDAKISLADYLEIVLQHFPKEQSLPAMKLVLDSLHGRGFNALDTFTYYYPQSEKRLAVISQLEKMLWNRLIKAKAGSGHQKILFTSYTKLAESLEAQKRLAGFLKSARPLKGFKVDQDLRWTVIKRLSQNNYAGVAKLIAAEKKRDSSEEGMKQAIAAEVLSPDIKVKKAWLEKLGQKNEESLGRQKAAMDHLFTGAQAQVYAELLSLVLEQTATLATEKDQEFMGTWAESMIPRYCDESSREKMESFLKSKSSRLPPAIVKPLRIHLQEEQRCILIRAKMGEGAAIKTGT
ncbi:MAG: aminopeptidase N [Bdellovibrionales bacterium]